METTTTANLGINVANDFVSNTRDTSTTNTKEAIDAKLVVHKKSVIDGLNVIIYRLESSVASAYVLQYETGNGSKTELFPSDEFDSVCKRYMKVLGSLLKT